MKQVPSSSYSIPLSHLRQPIISLILRQRSAHHSSLRRSLKPGGSATFRRMTWSPFLITIIKFGAKCSHQQQTWNTWSGMKILQNLLRHGQPPAFGIMDLRICWDFWVKIYLYELEDIALFSSWSSHGMTKWKIMPFLTPRIATLAVLCDALVPCALIIHRWFGPLLIE